MRDRHWRKYQKRTIPKILRIPLFILVSFLCIRLGILAGNTVFNMNTDVIKQLDSQNFKTVINHSLPVIDTIYNSGKVNVSITSEISRLIKGIFDFDLAFPATILNAQSPLFLSYYRNGYPALVAERDKSEQQDSFSTDNSDAQPGENTDIVPLPEDMEEIVQEDTEVAEDISGVYYEEENTEKDFSLDNAVTSGKVTLQNQTKFKVTEKDIEKMLSEPLKMKFDRKGPKILVFHTHTTESYVRNAADIGKSKKEVNNWTLDPKYSVVRIGDILSDELQKKGMEVIHNGTIHDYPNYNSSYSNSLSTIKSYLKSYPSIEIAFDIHRDGLSTDQKLRSVAKVDGKNAAQIMFVIGTNGSGLNHPQWKENLKLAVKIQSKLNELYPGLTKPIFLRKERFNQHMTLGSLIIEVGGDGNTLDEAMLSAKYLANAIGEVLKK